MIVMMGQTAGQQDVDLVTGLITALGYKFRINGFPGSIVISAVDHELPRPDPEIFREISGVKRIVNIPVSDLSQSAVK